MRICLWGGPGCGKSTQAAEVYSRLKRQGHSIELVREFIKEMAYEGVKPQGFDTVYIFGNQIRAEEKALRFCDHIVTDSPVLMQVYYAEAYRFECAEQMFDIGLAYERKHSEALHLFIKRPDVPYVKEGRYETEEEALVRDREIKTFMRICGIEFQTIEANAVASVVSARI